MDNFFDIKEADQCGFVLWFFTFSHQTKCRSVWDWTQDIFTFNFWVVLEDISSPVTGFNEHHILPPLPAVLLKVLSKFLLSSFFNKCTKHHTNTFTVTTKQTE